MRIMIDNSVWVETVNYPELGKLVQELGSRHELRSSEITDREMDESARIMNMEYAGRGDTLRKTYGEARITGKVKLSERVETLAEEYMVLLKPSKKQRKLWKNDLRLAACAALDSIDVVFTFNKKTLGSEKFQLVYKQVNIKRKLKTPIFIKQADLLRRFLGA